MDIWLISPKNARNNLKRCFKQFVTLHKHSLTHPSATARPLRNTLHSVHFRHTLTSFCVEVELYFCDSKSAANLSSFVDLRALHVNGFLPPTNGSLEISGGQTVSRVHLKNVLGFRARLPSTAHHRLQARKVHTVVFCGLLTEGLSCHCVCLAWVFSQRAHNCPVLWFTCALWNLRTHASWHSTQEQSVALSASCPKRQAFNTL